MRDKRRLTALILILSAAVPLACGGGGGSGSGSPGGGGNLVLVDMNVAGGQRLPLNRILRFEFSESMDPDSVRPDTIRILRGPNFAAHVQGTFQVKGNVVQFFPQIPLKPNLSDAGLQPSSTYRVLLPGYPEESTVLSVSGERLSRETSAEFTTASAPDPLFEDNFADGGNPAVAFANPPDGSVDVHTPSELTLTFNRRPLDPATVTPENIRLTLVSRAGKTYERPVDSTLELEQSHDLVVVRIATEFPLADRATYRLDVERRVQDLVGRDAERFSGTFTTADEPPRPGEILLEFDAKDRDTSMDGQATTASWNEEKPGALVALFTVAGGDGTAGDLKPTQDVTLTPDAFTPGARVQVVDGVETDVINFRTIEIPKGVRVTFAPGSSGPDRPLVLLSLRDVNIAGVLDVSGGVGEAAPQSATSSNLPVSHGGAGGPGATNGATNYTGSLYDTAPEQDADDVSGGPTGGHGGSASGHSTYSWAGGGGGGASRNDGQSGTGGGYSGAYDGAGGAGGESPESQGLDANLERRPNLGGAGGGAGGLGYYAASNPMWRQAGGGGGGGGGAVTLQSGGDVRLTGTSRIAAGGGDGGSASNSYTYYGGAGGGGGGGSVRIRAAGLVELDSGATIDVSGGAGGAYVNTYTFYVGGEGGDGGDGYIRIEAAEDGNSPGNPLVTGLSQASLTSGSVTSGLFTPRGGGAPTVGQTVFMNLGVFDPEMIAPAEDDIEATLFNDEMRIEVQMAVEDPADFRNPDLSALDRLDADGDGSRDDTLDPAVLSEWTPLSDIEHLNGKGYSFLRIRVTFQLDPDQGPDDPFPNLERLRIPYRY